MAYIKDKVIRWKLQSFNEFCWHRILGKIGSVRQCDLEQIMLKCFFHVINHCETK